MDQRTFDVSGPRRINTSATSRPIIVGHHPIMADPMMRPSTPAAQPQASAATTPTSTMPDASPNMPATEPAAPIATHTPKVIQVTEEVKQDMAAAQSPPPAPSEPGLAAAPSPAPEPMPQPTLAAAPQSPVPATKPEIPPEPPRHDMSSDPPALPTPPSHDSPDGVPAQQLPQIPQQDLSHIPHMPVSEHRRRFGLKNFLMWFAILGFLVAFGGYLLADAGIVPGSSHLPVHIFKQNQIAQEPTVKAPATVSQTSNTPPATSSTDPTSTWTVVSSKDGKFSFKYPTTWVTPTNSSACSPTILLLGANKQSVGTCGSENFGQMAVSYNKGDIRAQLYLTPANDSNIVKTAVTVDGVSGFKETGTVKNAQAEGMPVGTKIEQFTFYANGTTYSFAYAQLSGVPDSVADFETMVTTTLKFSA